MDNVLFEKISLKGIHNRYDLDIKFNTGLTVLHGQNGSGKSTLLHILANIANCDFIRFAFIEFETIDVEYSNGHKLSLKRMLNKEKGTDVISIHLPNGRKFSFTKDDALEVVSLFEREDTFYHRSRVSHLERKLDEFIEDNKSLKIGIAYFPAFRTMLEAWASQKEVQDARSSNGRRMPMSRATEFSRNLFGNFLPQINFPSPVEIEYNLRKEVRDAQMNIARNESSIFSESFVKIFSALLDGSNNEEIDSSMLLQEIAFLTTSSTSSKLGELEDSSSTYQRLQSLVFDAQGDVSSSTNGALSVYRDALKERQVFRVEAFKEIDKYLSVVNSFLDKKYLSYSYDKQRRIPRVGLEFSDGTWSSIQVMSSGERQLLTMLYAVNRMSGNSAVLIDEPELSLHIDWQEELLGKMMEQLGNRQIIVCTHSPSIAADFDEYMIEVRPKFKDNSENIEDITFDYDEDYL
ncbi:AAA family ATPase [Vibrio vulnificus]|uniref:AAA family ATPase n=1 Tax=Vibrio vulnificus TaxID=672 RepID=UPI001A1FC3B2|nr:AAA family ATPase [Vibrio vulnificus]ELV8710878.1 AAA family ATPase [Vibrio vulnificus]MCA3984048.1 AAA family ATPase [Vibrio vulnificus]MCU8549257.1 AAA family ATPase [Vibrio vulnificus]MCU8579796.1 AAA family ATPase [Vibrio vulnificus]HAS8223421.1 AAA family ATPase [Vibrio vulnificus]